MIHADEITGIAIVFGVIVAVVLAAVTFWLPLFLYSWHWWFG